MTAPSDIPTATEKLAAIGKAFNDSFGAWAANARRGPWWKPQPACTRVTEPAPRPEHPDHRGEWLS